jgi:predicted  nucleic acid-binding Zn-ribbon protein
MVFKGFKQVVEQSDLTFENGYIYFVRTNDAKTEGYIYFNGKKYGNVSELRTELEAEITENAKITAAALNDLQLQIDNINSVQAEVLEGINKTIEELQGRVDTAEGDIDALEGRVDAVESGLTALEGRMDTAEGDFDALEGRVDAVESGLTALEGRMDTAEGDIDALEGRMDTVESGLTALEGRMDTVESGLTALEGRVDTVEGRVDAVESGLTALEGRMDTAEGDIDALESGLTALEQTVSDNKVTNFEYVTSGDSKDLVITLGDGTKYSVDAKNFIKDGMLDNASLSEESGVTYLILTFNTEAGKEDIKLDVSTLIDIYTGDNKTIKVENNQISAIVDQKDGLVSYNSFETLFTIGGDDVE